MLLCYVNDVTQGIFMHFLLLVIFIIFVGGTMFYQRKSTGTANFPASFATGSFIDLVFAFILRLISCPYNPLISDIALAVCLVLSLIAVFMLLKEET